MNLIFLYGAPAVGKLTIAKSLEQKTGYKLLHNHLLQNPISEIFSFDNPSNRLLVREFRMRILEEAIRSNINLIFTFGIAGNKPFDHIDGIVNTAKLHGAKIYIVQLIADKETLLERVENQSRKDHGKNLSKDYLKKLFSENSDMLDKYPKLDHLTIDTKSFTPEQSAIKIIEFYKIA
ncbi:AAA family ATPase [Patescibacteria group bacterium]|nr:AAA family ATPase [Patescibacteria group bacterium]MCL5010016.1 AAA family ATPase [Patescibacteria group bacterium]